MASARDHTERGLISKRTGLKSYLSKWAVRETAGSTALVKFRDSLAPLTCTGIVGTDGAVGNVTDGLHMIHVSVVTVYPGCAATGGETSLKGSSDNTWKEFTSAGTVIVALSALPTYTRADGQTPAAKIVGRRIYVTKKGAPATTVTPTNAQWFLILADLATTVAAGDNATYLPKGTLTVADTTGFAAAGNLIVATDQGYEMVTYTAIGSGTTFTGCTGGRGKLSTGGTVKQPMLGDNTTTTYSWNIADANLANTRPAIIDTSGDHLGEVYLAANQTADSPNGWGIATENDGGVYVEVNSGTVSWQVIGQ